MTRIHPTAIVSPEAQLGADVVIGPFCVVYDNVIIGDGSVIEAFCEIGYPTPRADGKPLCIGKGGRIRSHSLFYEGSTFGDKLITGHRVTVREGTTAGENLQIGTLDDIQGSCVIGDFVRFHSNVHIGQLSTIGDFVWIFPYVVLTNDSRPPSEHLVGASIGDYAAIATMSVVLPGVKVGANTLVGAHSLVGKDVPDGMAVSGSPAKIMCEASQLKLKDGTGRQAYPWINHFRRGYPEEVVSRWLDELQARQQQREA